jgi:hypothetical protein
MPTTTTTELIRDRGMSVIASDIPAGMTLAQYRRRPQVQAAPTPRLTPRLLRSVR